MIAILICIKPGRKPLITKYVSLISQKLATFQRLDLGGIDQGCEAMLVLPTEILIPQTPNSIDICLLGGKHERCVARVRRYRMSRARNGSFQLLLNLSSCVSQGVVVFKHRWKIELQRG